MKARENPFATRHTERLAFRLPANLGWPTLLDRLKRRTTVARSSVATAAARARSSRSFSRTCANSVSSPS